MNFFFHRHRCHHIATLSSTSSTSSSDDELYFWRGRFSIRETFDRNSSITREEKKKPKKTKRRRSGGINGKTGGGGNKIQTIDDATLRLADAAEHLKNVAEKTALVTQKSLATSGWLADA